MLRQVLYGLAAAVVLFCGGYGFAQRPPEEQVVYLSSQACMQCHAEQYSSWQKSHHAGAWNRPDSSTVLGDFSDAVFVHDGVETRFARKNGDYIIKTQGADGQMRDYTVKYTAGITPLQQYLIETEPGRLQAFDVAWDTLSRRWFKLFPEQKIVAFDGLHWSGPYKNWNGRCAECHATDYRKNYDVRARRYHSVEAEIGVGCEACHGPGSRHVAWARSHGANEASEKAAPRITDPGRSSGTEALKGTPTGHKGLVIAFPSRSPEVEIQQCAGCHARRETLTGASPLPGTSFPDAYNIALLRPELYFADGAIKEEVYVYGSFLQSRMYKMGVRCSNCHEPHSGQVRAEGSGLCAQCHSSSGNAGFPSLAKKRYDTPQHHFHAAGSKAAECKSCHMMQRVYMGVDNRHDHSFRVPRPDLSIAVGVPNTCNDCHTDKTAQWAQDELRQRFPASRYQGGHFATIFARADENAPEQADALLTIAAEKQQPAIVRATALDRLRTVTNPQIAERAQPLLRDAEPMVRAAAAVLQRGAPVQARATVLAPVLSDSAKSVRIAAAKELIGAIGRETPASLLVQYRRANAELMAALQARTDFPETHLTLGALALRLRNVPAAQAAFREAVELDPQLVDGWVTLVRIDLELGRRSLAQTVLQQALKANPNDETLNQMQRSMDSSRN